MDSQDKRRTRLSSSITRRPCRASRRACRARTHNPLGHKVVYESNAARASTAQPRSREPDARGQPRIIVTGV